MTSARLVFPLAASLGVAAMLFAVFGAGAAPGGAPVEPQRTSPRVERAVETFAPRASSVVADTDRASDAAAEPLLAPTLTGHFGPSVPHEGRTAQLTGRITAGGNAARATLRFVAGPNLGATLVTEADGSYDWPELYPGYALLEVDAGARCTREVTLRHRRTDTHDLDFGAHGVLLGRLLDPDGAPVPGAEVELDGNLSVSGNTGWFELPRVAAGENLLVVRAAGFVPYCERVRADVGHSQEAPLDVALQRGSVLELSLGALPAGAESGSDAEVLVWLLPGAGQRLAGSPPRVAYPWHELNPVRLRAGASLVLHDMPHGRIDAVALHPLARGREFAWLTAHPGLVDQRIPLHVELEAVDLLRVSVRLGGEPVPGAHVELGYANRMASTLQSFGDTGATLLNTQALQRAPAAQHSALTSEDGVAVLGLDSRIRTAPFLTVSSADGELRLTRRLASGERESVFELDCPGEL